MFAMPDKPTALTDGANWMIELNFEKMGGLIPAIAQDSPLDNLPAHVTQVTHFGERAVWSPDGARIAFETVQAAEAVAGNPVVGFRLAQLPEGDDAWAAVARPVEGRAPRARGPRARLEAGAPGQVARCHFKHCSAPSRSRVRRRSAPNQCLGWLRRTRHVPSG